MTTDETVHRPAAAPEPTAPQQGDFAPISPSQLASTAAEDLTTLPVQTENLVLLEPHKRKKTSGEKVFDVATYGGVALLGNEGLSTIVMTQAEKGMLKTPFDSFVNACKNVKEAKYIPKYLTEGRLPTILFACIGGMFTVFPVKFLEDRKGPIVRKLDHWFHGAKSDTDPHMIMAHEEMDKAPHQSWGSLWKGRLITVVSATIADVTMGWHDSFLSRALKDTKLSRYSSLDHISWRFGEAATRMVDPKGLDQGIKDALKTYKGREEMVALKEQSKFYGIAKNSVWLLALSTSLTVLFYVTSKMFAKNTAINKEHKLAKQQGNPFSQQDETPGTIPNADLPDVKVNQVAYQQLVDTSQPAIHLS